MTDQCGDEARDTSGWARVCFLANGHDGPHTDQHGYRWQDADVVLKRLQNRWGETHRVSCTGHMWMAVAHDPDAEWRTHIEPTPEQLEGSLRRHVEAKFPQAPIGHGGDATPTKGS